MTYILAEIASAHMGQADLCREMVMGAYLARADGVKFQIWNDQDIRDNPSYKNLKRFELTLGDWEQLIYQAQILDLDVWAEVYSTQTMERVKDFNPDFFKISYQRFLKTPLIGETEEIPVFWRTQSGPPIYGQHVSIGEQGFPTTKLQARKEIELVREYAQAKGSDFNICYADHQNAYGLIDDIERDITSVAARNAGAQYIEKHICLDRETLRRESRDYISALEPDEFRDYVEFMKSENSKIGVIL